MTRVILVREEGDGSALREALEAELGMEILFLTAASEQVQGDIVLPLYPQSNKTSSQLARKVRGGDHLVWFSYLQGYIDAVAEGLTGHVVFCAEDLQGELYRRDVGDSAKKIAAKAGVTYELAYGDAPPEGQRVALTIPIPCETARRWHANTSWGTRPAFVKALADLVRRALSGDD